MRECPQFRGVLIIERGSTVVRECPQFRGVLIIERGSTVVRECFIHYPGLCLNRDGHCRGLSAPGRREAGPGRWSKRCGQPEQL